MNKIDLVVPYVDSSDPAWKELFDKYNPIKDREIEGINAKNRFRGQGDFFRFFFRGIEKYMPWINKVHLLVQSESQVPKWIDRDVVHVVLHEEFIPKEFLPTFNSTCIEMFLWNIPELSEQFVYTNDDMFVINPVRPSDLFEEFKVISRIFNVTRMPDSVYYQQVDNSYKEIYGYLQNECVTIGHNLRPYYKSVMKDCFEKHKDNILKSISAFRESKNFNVYLFTYDLEKRGDVINMQRIDNITTSKLSMIQNILIKNNKTTICIQDGEGDANIYEDDDLISTFKNKFPKQSKYEIPGVLVTPTPQQLKKIDDILNKVPENLRNSFRDILLKSLSF